MIEKYNKYENNEDEDDDLIQEIGDMLFKAPDGAMLVVEPKAYVKALKNANEIAKLFNVLDDDEHVVIDEKKPLLATDRYMLVNIEVPNLVEINDTKRFAELVKDVTAISINCMVDDDGEPDPEKGYVVHLLYDNVYYMALDEK